MRSVAAIVLITAGILSIALGIMEFVIAVALGPAVVSLAAGDMLIVFGQDVRRRYAPRKDGTPGNPASKKRRASADVGGP